MNVSTIEINSNETRVGSRGNETDFNDFKAISFEDAIKGLNSNTCPVCHNLLRYDIQQDSIYIACDCGGFEISTFRDKFDGKLMLYYLNNSDEGGVDSNNLKTLQKVLYRNSYIKKSLFTLKVREKII